jgi:putative DNA methylase
MTYKKKLIEVALPLEAINKEAVREKSIKSGHPFTIHLWWSRKPLTACRAVLFAQLVDDPASNPTEFPTEESQERSDSAYSELLRNYPNGRTQMTEGQSRRRSRNC